MHLDAPAIIGRPAALGALEIMNIIPSGRLFCACMSTAERVFTNKGPESKSLENADKSPGEPQYRTSVEGGER